MPRWWCQQSCASICNRMGTMSPRQCLQGKELHIIKFEVDLVIGFRWAMSRIPSLVDWSRYNPSMWILYISIQDKVQETGNTSFLDSSNKSPCWPDMLPAAWCCLLSAFSSLFCPSCRDCHRDPSPLQVPAGHSYPLPVVTASSAPLSPVAGQQWPQLLPGRPQLGLSQLLQALMVILLGRWWRPRRTQLQSRTGACGGACWHSPFWLCFGAEACCQTAPAASEGQSLGRASCQPSLTQGWPLPGSEQLRCWLQGCEWLRQTGLSGACGGDHDPLMVCFLGLAWC